MSKDSDKLNPIIETVTTEVEAGSTIYKDFEKLHMPQSSESLLQDLGSEWEEVIAYAMEAKADKDQFRQFLAWRGCFSEKK